MQHVQLLAFITYINMKNFLIILLSTPLLICCSKNGHDKQHFDSLLWKQIRATHIDSLYKNNTWWIDNEMAKDLVNQKSVIGKDLNFINDSIGTTYTTDTLLELSLNNNYDGWIIYPLGQSNEGDPNDGDWLILHHKDSIIQVAEIQTR